MNGWSDEVAEMLRREELGRVMGGPAKLERQRAAGKYNVRERIEKLLDPGSLHEIGTLTGRATYENGQLTNLTPVSPIIGRGEIERRGVVVTGDDFTVRGGASDAYITHKMLYAERMAVELGWPIVRMIDGTGGGGSIRSLLEMGRTYVPMLTGWDDLVHSLARVPVVALALGPCAGAGAARVVNSHFVVMVRGQSQIFTAGPPLVAAIGEDVTKEGLGGHELHGANGVADALVDNEDEAFDFTRRFLSYLPSSVDELPPRTEPNDDPDRADEWLIEAIPRNPRQVYKIRDVIASLVDTDSFFEWGRGHGRAAVTGFARLDGWPVALLSNDPYVYGGSWDAAASEKIIRFIDMADTFHLPVVHLVDNPGFRIGVAAEREGAIRYGARALAAIHQASVPWCSIILRKVYGVGGAGHANASRFQFRYAWPSSDWGSLPSAGGIEAAFTAELAQADDRDAAVAEIQQTLTEISSPFRTAEVFDIEQIIDPRRTRSLLCEFAGLVAANRRPGGTARPMRP